MEVELEVMVLPSSAYTVEADENTSPAKVATGTAVCYLFQSANLSLSCCRYPKSSLGKRRRTEQFTRKRRADAIVVVVERGIRW